MTRGADESTRGGYQNLQWRCLLHLLSYSKACHISI